MTGITALLREVLQLGYVTDDLPRAVAHFEERLGTSKCMVIWKSSLGGGVVVDGAVADEWVIDVAMVNAGPTNYELIQPVSGAVDLYRAGIRPGAVATFHHVGYRVASFAAASEAVAADGRAWKQYGDMGAAVKFGYLDLTAELGHYAEVMELGDGMRSVFARLERESNGE